MQDIPDDDDVDTGMNSTEREDIPDPPDGRLLRRPRGRSARRLFRNAIRNYSKRKSSYGDMFDSRQKRKAAKEFCEQYLLDLNVQRAVLQDFLAKQFFKRKPGNSYASRKQKARMSYEQLLK